LVDANVTLKDSAGAAIAHTFLWLMPMEFIHCTGFVNGLLIDLNGVVSQTEASQNVVIVLHNVKTTQRNSVL
jgi:hypothetical protein